MANFYNPYYQQPYQMPMSQQQPPQPIQQTQQQGGMIWVGSLMEAQQYFMAPNSAVTLWDSNAPTVYLKQTDASGRPTLKIYDLVERKAPVQQEEKPVVEYATKAELDELVARVEALSAPTPKKAKKEVEE